MECIERNLITRVWTFCHSEFNHTCFDHDLNRIRNAQRWSKAFLPSIVVARTPYPSVITSFNKFYVFGFPFFCCFLTQLVNKGGLATGRRVINRLRHLKLGKMRRRNAKNRMPNW